MRHRRKVYKLGRRSAHLKSLIANQVSSLILYGQIETTVQKAKGTKQLAEKMVTYAKKGDLHHRRLAISKIKNKEAVKILFSKIAPLFADRKGGYTSLLKVGKRNGDSADMAILKWVSMPVETSKNSDNQTTKSDEAVKKKSENTEAAN